MDELIKQLAKLVYQVVKDEYLAARFPIVDGKLFANLIKAAERQSAEQGIDLTQFPRFYLPMLVAIHALGPKDVGPARSEVIERLSDLIHATPAVEAAHDAAQDAGGGAAEDRLDPRQQQILDIVTAYGCGCLRTPDEEPHELAWSSTWLEARITLQEIVRKSVEAIHRITRLQPTGWSG